MSQFLKQLTDRTLAYSGKQAVAGGLILKWVNVQHTAGLGQAQTYTWDAPFPNGVLHIQVTDNSDTAAGAAVWSVNGEGPAGFNLFWNYSNTTGGTTNRAAFVLAIGH